MLCLAACGARSTTSRCHFQAETNVATLANGGADGVSLVRVGTGSIAFWSDADGLSARHLNDAGTATAPSARLVARCDGGMDAAEYGGRALVACQHAGETHSVELLSVTPDLRSRQVAEWRSDTEHGRGVALAASANAIVVAWSNGARGHERIWFGRVMNGVVEAADSIASNHDSAIEPDAFFFNNDLTLTWVGMSSDGDSEHAGHVMLYSGHGAPESVAEVHCVSPSPRLASDARGLIVSFRDVRAPDPHAGLFLLRVGQHVDPSRVARANALGAQDWIRCPRGLFAAAPRTFRSDALIGVSRISSELARIGGEVQIYQTQSDLALVDTACASDGLLALFADEARESTHTPSIRATRLTCDAEAN